ncbi:MAG: hypothetical protein KGL46_09325 [Hyphomicrobiales bacterium]|nr:hypothetical protein [Hyphomicrobiales bacterium]
MLPHEDSANAHPAETLGERASALVNPNSGLANDFLNVYNEILMLIENLPAVPELFDDILAWRPASYGAYFMQSQFDGRDKALEAYAQLDPQFRARFEQVVVDLAESALRAVAEVACAVAEHDDEKRLAQVCETAAEKVRRVLPMAAQMVNFGHVQPGADDQARVNRIFSAA